MWIKGPKYFVKASLEKFPAKKFLIFSIKYQFIIALNKDKSFPFSVINQLLDILASNPFVYPLIT